MYKDIGRRWGGIKVVSEWRLTAKLQRSIYGKDELCAEFRHVCTHDGVPTRRPVRLPDIRHLSQNDLADENTTTLLRLVGISDEQMEDARALFNQAAKDQCKVVSFTVSRANPAKTDPPDHQMAASSSPTLQRE